MCMRSIFVWTKSVHLQCFCIVWIMESMLPTVMWKIFHVNSKRGKRVYSPCSHHDGVRGNGTVVALILDLATRWRWVVNLEPWSLYLCGWARKLVWVFWRRDTSFAFAEIQAMDRLDQPILYTDFPIMTPVEQYNIKIINK